MPLGGFSQNWSARRTQSPKKETIEVEKIVEKTIIDPKIEKQLEKNLNSEIECITKLVKEVRYCNELLEELVMNTDIYERN